jgi:hypothetical protein
MRRVEVLVEGQTEQGFVENVLAPHLSAHGVQIWAVLYGKQGRRRGGIKKWAVAKEDILRSLYSKSCQTTTLMVDYYGMPADWPGREASPALHGEAKALTVERAITEDIENTFPGGLIPGRFIPYVQLHEFEALMFVDEKFLAHALSGLNPGADSDVLKTKILTITTGFPNPEEINDDPKTSPSHRIRNLVRVYNKPLVGTMVAGQIGIARLRERCPHFAQWVAQLEKLTALPNVDHI